MVLMCVLYILTILIPINGLIFLGMRNENITNRRLLRMYWKLRK